MGETVQSKWYFTEYELRNTFSVTRVLELRRITLDRLGIRELENLECYTMATHVFLQHVSSIR